MGEITSVEKRIFANKISQKISEKEIVVIGNDCYAFSYNKVLHYVRLHKLNKTPKGYSVSSLLVNKESVATELCENFFSMTDEARLKIVKKYLG